jgi:DNA-binding NarL/FixJ family response regulator
LKNEPGLNGVIISIRTLRPFTPDKEDLMSEKSILLVEDDNLLRMGLKSMIDLHGGYKVTHHVGTGADAIQAFTKSPVDIVLLDLNLPDSHGTDILKTIKKNYINTKVIILSVFDNNEIIYQTMENGADGYVLKCANPDEIFMAIDYAISNTLFISPRIVKCIIKDYLFVNRQRKSLPPLHSLTAREKEVAKHIIDGKKSKEIAEELYISIKTVNKHRSNILGKLGIRNFNEFRIGEIYFIDDL